MKSSNGKDVSIGVPLSLLTLFSSIIPPFSLIVKSSYAVESSDFWKHTTFSALYSELEKKLRVIGCLLPW